MINCVYLLIIKIQPTIFFQKFCRRSLVIFLQEIYLPVFNISPQLSYWQFFWNNLINAPFSQLVVKNLIIIIPNISWIKVINFKVRLTSLDPNWFNIGIFKNNALFIWYITAYNVSLFYRFYSLNITPRPVRITNTNNFICNPTFHKTKHLCIWYIIIMMPYMDITKQIYFLLQIKSSQ